ncbi:MAG: GNAT family N-acetyltransferase [Pseudomonadota bacterium]
MADGDQSFIARTVSRIDDIDPALWDALASPKGVARNPFVSHAFLSALEASKSVAPEAGWTPIHLILEDNGAVVGAVPLYAKGHSQGEYVFDHHWADAYERAGGRYYPKLVCAAPFTPVKGPRLLARTSETRSALGLAVANVAARMGASSVHVNFIDNTDKEALTSIGYLPRMGEQYHWFNRDYEKYDNFLDALSSRKRKTIRRERREAVSSGLKIRQLVGSDISEQHWDAFWLFYQDTGARKWGYPYLTRTFFRIIAETMADELLMVVAERDNEPIAGALNFIGGDALYGRYWGCAEDHPFLHFELCYHQAIEFAIERKLARVEAGAQGQHKIARGYEPVATHSAHWIGDPGFRDAISQYLKAERAQTGAEIDALQQFIPFKKSVQD